MSSQKNDAKHQCPLLNKIIDDGDCMETALYAEGDIYWEPMKEAKEIEGFEKVCNSCPYHIWD